MKKKRLLMTLVLGMIASQQAFAQSAASNRGVIEFTAEKPEFDAAAEEYRAIWAAEGARIVSSMERITGLPWESNAIKAVVFEGISSSGYGDIPMRLRASYPSDTKRATLVHELGHRIFSHFRLPSGVENHAVLFLFVYDLWVELWGQDFADAQVKVELQRGGPYPAAWESALSTTPAGRAARWKEIVSANLRAETRK
jgi:hypothetical protein